VGNRSGGCHGQLSSQASHARRCGGGADHRVLGRACGFGSGERLRPGGQLPFFDPATRYEGAQTVAGLLPNSRLLSYAGWGHTVYWGVSSCVDAAVNAYLIDGVLPAQGTVCQPEIDPFAPVEPEPLAVGAELRRTGRSAMLPEATKRALRG